jgi:hypothetical protein
MLNLLFDFIHVFLVITSSLLHVKSKYGDTKSNAFQEELKRINLAKNRASVSALRNKYGWTAKSISEGVEEFYNNSTYQAMIKDHEEQFKNRYVCVGRYLFKYIFKLYIVAYLLT